ncbi:MAG: phytanoyl-CoA dioxygenase family protein [Albidovulum sp.]|nr:phytanoyl-CoA dioxygenase family protein [Albidovulum sp.]
MDFGAWKPHLITADEQAAFERDGYFVISDAVDGTHLSSLVEVADRLRDENRDKSGIGPRDLGALKCTDRLNLKDVAVKDPAFLELLHWPATFPKVFGILGWNIQLYHSQLVVAPPVARREDDHNRGSWHQDSGRLNIELEGDPRPRVSLKIGFYLTDNTTSGCGNFCVVPGSHRRNQLERPGGGEPEGATQVLAKPGDAVIFDRRIWHTATPNYARFDRKILFYGYSFRWLRPRSDIALSEEFAKELDPVQRQLLGIGASNMSCTAPLPADVPLKGWIEENAPGSVPSSLAA